MLYNFEILNKDSPAATLWLTGSFIEVGCEATEASTETGAEATAVFCAATLSSCPARILLLAN